MSNGTGGDLKGIKCGACGASLVKSMRIEGSGEDAEEIPIAKCSSCGKVYDQHTDEYYQVFADTLTYDKDNTIFKLGTKGTLRGVEYEIIGRLRYQEEEEYEKSTWDEWFAVSSDGVYHYFVEEDGEVYSYEEYTPKSIDMNTASGGIEFEGKRIMKRSGFVGRIVYAEGELSWKPEIGEAITMWDFKKDGVMYTIEQSEDEVDITRGEHLTYEEVIQAFGHEDDKKKYTNTIKKRRTYKLKGMLYIAASIVSLVMAIGGCLNTSSVQGVMTGRMDLMVNQLKSEGAEKSFTSQVLYGPFKLEKGNSLYNAEVFIDEKIQKLSLEWQSFRLMLVPEERLKKALNNQLSPQNIRELVADIDALKEPLEVYVISGDFWDETGYDDEGYWHESDLTGNDDFILEKGGQYYAYLELYSKNPRKIESVGIKIERVSSYRYFLLVILVFGVLAWYNIWRSMRYNELSFEIASK